MLVLIGKSTSGKDTIRDILVKKHGFHPIVTYTTRPIRVGEIQDSTYHFITEEDFKGKIDNEFFAEWKKYNVDSNVWYYGSAKEDLLNTDNNSVIILTPEGVRDIKKNGVEATVIYLYANLATIKNRLQIRGDKNDKAEDRIERDLKDFKGVETLAEKIVYNNLDDNLEDVISSILSYYKEMNK